ncbi:MAG: 5'/3'-nucleotidase SurE [Candidatus Bipolaricaulota bacterium]
MAKPFILLSNDDGYLASGLLALRDALLDFADVWIMAPDRNWSAASRTRIFHKPLRVSKVQLADGQSIRITNGAPSDCVSLALLGLAPQKPDLVVAGINAGANIGRDVTYSGTVAAAMEGAQAGIPAVAVSQDLGPEGSEDSPPDYRLAARVAAQVVRFVLEEQPLNPGTLLNVNTPASVPAGVRITRLGTKTYRDELVQGKDPKGREYYWMAGEMLTEPPTDAAGTDVEAVLSGYISITPLQMDLTAYPLMGALQAWEGRITLA